MVGRTPRHPSRRPVAASLLLAAMVSLVGCGGDDEPELTFEDHLVEIEGRPVSPIEVAERAEVGEVLCQLDDQILDRIWIELTDEQLAFQDAVFSTICPERSIFYAGRTGRKVTEEAEQSGVETSTTRPTSTTTGRPTSGSPTRPFTIPGLDDPDPTPPDDDPDPSAGSTTPTTRARTTSTDRSTTTG